MQTRMESYRNSLNALLTIVQLTGEYVGVDLVCDGENRSSLLINEATREEERGDLQYDQREGNEDMKVVVSSSHPSFNGP